MSRNQTLAVSLATALFAGAVLAPSRAEAGSITLLSSSAPVATSATASGGAGIAVQFTLNQTSTINEVDMMLATGGKQIAASDLYVQFYSSVNNKYKSFIDQLAFAPSSLNSSTFKNVAFTSTHDVTLQAGTYFMFLFDASTNPIYWQTNNGTGNYTTPYGSISGRVYATNYYTDHPQFTMMGTAVPEPAALTMAATGMAVTGVVAARRRRRGRQNRA